jgi:hypothetical protein
LLTVVCRLELEDFADLVLELLLAGGQGFRLPGELLDGLLLFGLGIFELRELVL